MGPSNATSPAKLVLSSTKRVNGSNGMIVMAMSRSLWVHIGICEPLNINVCELDCVSLLLYKLPAPPPRKENVFRD